jgi:glutamate-5-semialdehyde dehydrogenase
LIEKTDRSLVKELLVQKTYIDLVIPRGGRQLIDFVAETSHIPVIKHDMGNCHVFVDAHADRQMAIDIAVNAKVQRPGVCNAMETLLVHQDFAYLADLVNALIEQGVEVRGCEKTQQAGVAVKPATEVDWLTEYLDLILAVRVVPDITAAMAHIRQYGSGHSEAIITNDYQHAQVFLREVDSSSVFINASTRFADGGEYGLGAEIGISTQKLHARGPMGIRELTCEKFIIYGDGQIRR